jgi:RecA-family ATPase
MSTSLVWQELVNVAHAGPQIVTFDEFADVQEEGAEAILGDEENAIFGEDFDVMIYGDGGAGKSTLTIDAASTSPPATTGSRSTSRVP